MTDFSSATTTATMTTQLPLRPNTIHLHHDSTKKNDIAKLPATEALRLLSATLEMLVKVTGDVPPTPPPRTPTDPKMSDLQAEKEHIKARASLEGSRPTSRASSPKPSCDQKSSGSPTGSANPPAQSDGGNSKLQEYRAAMAAQLKSAQQQVIDGVKLKIDPPPTMQEPENSQTPVIVVVGADSQPLTTQHGAITRKFYSKLEPPITITQYLLRLHQFCPMSTAVYLATSLYIHRLAVEQRAIPVTRRNVHRLVLAGLRVATKALEDLAYPHAKVARVGGVSEAELARLEISFCFLAGFELVIGEEGLSQHWESLRDGKWQVQEKTFELRIGRPPKVPTPDE